MFSWADSILQDVRYFARGLARNPGFTISALLAAALGIGSTTAVFSVVDRLLLRPLPYHHAQELVSIGMMAPLDTNEFMFASGYMDLQREKGPLSGVTAFQAGSQDCDITEQNPVRQRCMKVPANFFEVLGVSLAAGRPFTLDQDRPHVPPVALISHSLWRSRFGSDPAAVGRKLEIDGVPTPIAGVLPPGFEMPTLATADILLPMQLDEATEREGRAFRVFARLKPDTNATQARAALQPHFDRELATVPPRFRKEITFRVQPLRDRQVGDSRLAAFALVGAVISVLLIACANIANLLLARAVSRAPEMAMRTALGASRLRLIRQAFTESLLLSGCGGVLGSVLAWALLRAFVALGTGALPRLDQASIDPRVLGFALAASVGAGLLFGLAPALRASDVSLAGGTRVTPSSVYGLRAALVTLQVAACVVLLAGAGLLMSSLWRLQQVPLGMQTDHVVAARFVLGLHRYGRGEDQLEFFRALEERLKSVPGVQTAAITDSLPPSGGWRGRPLSTIAVEGVPEMPEGTGGMVAWRYITPEYFTVLGIPIQRGRGFTNEDRAPDAFRIILNETLARRLFPHQDPVGRHVLRGPQGEWFTVAGIAADTRSRGPAADVGPEYYVVRKASADVTWRNAEPPEGWRSAYVVARTSIDPGVASGGIRAAVAALDPTIPVQLETMPQRMEGINARPRFNALLLGFFALAGLVLAAIGLYGVLSFLVAMRTREFGIRMALGAAPASIMSLAVRDAGLWMGMGLILGWPGL
ncbi:MAG: ABC transporter permease [Bryobacteraceae bacterium]